METTGFWTTLLIVSDWAIRLVMLPIVPTRRSPEAAKGWLLFIFFLPWVGLLLYVLIGRPRLPRWRIERRDEYLGLIRAIRDRRPAPAVIAAPAVSPQYEPSVRLATDLGLLDNLGGNAVELLTDYAVTISRIAADIDGAVDHAHLCFYIFGDDARSALVIEALGRAVVRGVVCRVLVDAFGSRPSLRTLLPKLRALGIAVLVALPVRVARKTARFDLRNHRKIVVVDGRIGYTGSQNLVSADFKPGLTYSELMVRIEGPSALQLQAVFGSDWFVESGEFIGEQAFPIPAAVGETPAQMLANGPSSSTQRAHRMVVNLIYSATRRVVVTTPYFIPSQSLQDAMETAVHRGAEVHLIVDDHIDQFFVGNAQRSYYESLLLAGVQIHAYTEAFLHTKSVSIDGQVAWIGSSNLDMRSFELNEEVVALFFDPRIAAQLGAIEARYLQGSTPITLEQWRKRPFVSELLQNLTRLVSPLL
ncbi:MAG: cardiolipin synthase [Burkholderiaceae bacterium]|nr:cardiolipin synthase [Burkholderiaceae bacterium]